MPNDEAIYEAPLIITPLSSHTHTFILLHGRGSNANRFGIEFLQSTNLSSRLPTVKFIFPTARKRRSTALNRVAINQWFDNYSLDDPEQRTDLQVEGLCQTGGFLRRLIDREAEAFDNIDSDARYSRIILGGLSQGCAMGMFAFLAGVSHGGGKLGGFVGMSGWLPLRRQLEEFFQPLSLDDEDGSGIDEFDVFGRSSNSESGDEHPPLEAINHIRDILDLPPLSPTSSDGKPPAGHLQSPVFLGHGSADEKISIKLGEEMADFLAGKLQMDVTWKVYERFGHWYKTPDEIDDIVQFLQKEVGVPVSDIKG
ncbi:Phospholipase/Carboxylesterase [Aspergillus sp. HF37]|nr:Phospholipase/Carboxylesterase [Aspergillus sp. HF37]